MVDWWPCGGFKLVKACILRAAVNFALVGSGTRLRMKVKKKSSTVTTHCVHSTLLGEDWAFFIGGGGGRYPRASSIALYQSLQWYGGKGPLIPLLTYASFSELKRLSGT